VSKFKPNARMAAAVARPPLRRSDTVNPGSSDLSSAAATLTLPRKEDEVSPASVAFESSAQRFALNVALVFFFFRISFLHEYITGHTGIDLHLMIVLGGLCYLGCLISGRGAAAFRDKCTWLWVGFLIWMTIATLTSTWRGGSIFQWNDYVKTIFPIILIIPAVVTVKTDVRKFMTVIGLAGIANTALGFVSSDFKTGRMGLEAAGSIGDPNDYAAHLIFLIPAMVYFAFGLKKSVFYKIVGTLSVVAALYQILSTGSRGGLVSLMLFVLYVLVTGDRKLKVGILLGGPVLVLLALPLVPRNSIDRLNTLFESTPQQHTEAEESTEARRALLQASIDATLAHPIFGIGPSVFMDYEAGVAAELGKHGMWHGTHNAYTQISCECGIPALVLVVAALGLTFRYLRRVRQLGDDTLKGASATLAVMLFGFCVAIFFLTKGYNFNFLIVSGLAIAMNRMVSEGNAA